MQIKLLPVRRLNIETNLSVEEIKNILNENLLYNQNVRKVSSLNTYSLKEFEGHINDNNFEFRRILKHYRYSGIPVVQGEIIRESNVSVIKIKVAFQKYVKYFIFSVYVFYLILLTLYIISGNKINIIFWIFLFIPFLMFILVNITFQKELNKVMKFLQKIIPRS